MKLEPFGQIQVEIVPVMYKPPVCDRLNTQSILTPIYWHLWLMR
jgi:hypothetical protein